MVDRPILFSAPMVRALLAGTKTQTRRVLRLPTKTHSGGPIYERPDMGGWEPTTHGGGGCFTFGPAGEKIPAHEQVAIWHRTTGTCALAPWQPGDRAWVRETWRCNGWATDVATIMYRASEGDGYTAMTEQFPVSGKPRVRPDGLWRSSIHMPRWASRLTLLITEVRVERLQEIDEAGVAAEGIEPGRAIDWMGPEGARRDFGPVDGFRGLWNSIHGPGAWAENPWVVALTFRVVAQNIDSIAAEAGHGG